MRKKITPVLLAFGLYAVVVALVFGRALIPEAGYLLFGDDIHRQYYFYRQFFNSFLREGIWPWWNPYYFSGSPFIANPIVNIWYPATWLFFFLPLTVAYSWHIALHIVWAMTGMYVLMRIIDNSPQPPLLQRGGKGELRVISMLPAWIAGLVFGLSGFFMARVWAGHVDVIAAASWLPWVFGAFWQLHHDRWKNLRHGGEISTSLNRRVFVAGGLFAMQILAGYQTMAFFTMQAVFIFTLFRCSVVKSFKPFVRMMLAAALGLALAAIQILPTQEFFRASIRTFALPYSWNSYGSLTIESLKQLFNPFIFGDQMSYSGPPPNFAEHAFFVGRWSLVLIVFFFLHRSPRVLMFCSIALFGLWVSLGPHAPIDLQYILWKFIPIYTYLRIPPRHLILVVFGLSGMVGLAIEKFRKPFPLLLAAVISAEMILYARHFIDLKPIPETRHDPELIRILAQDKEPYRLLPNFGVWVPPRDSFDFDSAMQYRVFNATGYDPSILKSYYEFIDAANGAITPSILSHDVQVPYLNVFSPATDFLNIKYILVPRSYDPLYGVKSDRFVLLREDEARNYRLYENKTVKPRFFVDKGTATVTRYTPNEIVLATDTHREGTLMSSEIFYPGWEGFVDGKKIDIQKVNHAFRGLYLPAGRHTVIFRYRPTIFWWGGLVSLVTALLCLFFIYWDGRRSAKPLSL